MPTAAPIRTKSRDRRPRARPCRRHDGVALPWALFALVALGLLAATGVWIAWIETRSARSFATGTAAFYVADGGLETALAALGDPGPPPGTPPPAGPLTIGAGEARLRYDTLLRIGPGEHLVRIESEGRIVLGGDTARRRVGRLAWLASAPRAPAALLAIGPVAGGGTGSVTGLDAAGGCPGPPPAVAGLALPAGTPAPGGGIVFGGAPPILPIPPGVSVTAATGIRWGELIAAWGPLPDAAVPPDPWPVPGTRGGWPYTRLTSPATLGPSHSGRGTLVAEGDLTLDAGFAWRGLILTGGTLTLRGAVRVRGAVLANLAGVASPAVDPGPGPVDLAYDACAVERAAVALTAPAAAIPGTWFEAW